MKNTVTFKCETCGALETYSIGADATYSTWNDAIAHIGDEKETEKLLKLLVEISSSKSDLNMQAFSANPAEVLTNINYEACDVDSFALFDMQALAPVWENLINSPAVAPKINESRLKWVHALDRDGIVAFEGLYICPKQKTLSSGVYLRVRYNDGKKEKIYMHANVCPRCGTTAKLVDDGFLGFSHEGIPTLAKCGKCGGVLDVDHVIFNK